MGRFVMGCLVMGSLVMGCLVVGCLVVGRFVWEPKIQGREGKMQPKILDLKFKPQ